MNSNAILGRYFLNKEGYKIELKNNAVNIVKLNNDSLEENDSNFNDILYINYDECKNERNDKPHLNVNTELDIELRNEFVEVYNTEYVSKVNTGSRDGDNLNVDIKIVLNHEQLISFHPRRLSYSEQRNLQVIIDELLSEGVIRECNSLCNSIVA